MAVAQSSDTQGMFTRFVRSEATASILLLACTIAALAWANSPRSESYFRLGHTELGFKIGEAQRTRSLHDQTQLDAISNLRRAHKKCSRRG